MPGDNPLGSSVPNWSPPDRPHPVPIQGRYCSLEPLEPGKHAALLFREFTGRDDLWSYLPYGPFHSAASYHRWMRETVSQKEDLFFAIRDSERMITGGVASYLRITPEAGTIEVGNICLAPSLQRTRAATEAMVLMMQWAFEAGYRRYEWKCDALNQPSRQAAQRLGFSYEGVFRQARVVKGRNRDTAWFSVIDSEWNAMKEAYDAWLSPANFKANGQQIERLSDLTGLVRANDDPTQSSYLDPVLDRGHI
ncbi:MAG: GNAT family N-acetyltransferase [Rhodobacteraceae bacterium]|nr:GNAT family N-acetyltransferase [Paracoccaceae bacterium]